MGKLFKCFLVVSALFLSYSQMAMAQSYQYVAGEKLVTGLANAATGIAELPKNIIIVTHEKGLPYGMTIGLFTGIIHTVGRTVIGALDVATFLIPTGPSISPPYIWNDFYRETTYGSKY